MRSLILASQSPRRKVLLEKAGYSFAVLPSKVSEIPNENMTIDEQILDIAGRKARAIFYTLASQKNEPVWILSADTEVVIDNKTLGKPENPLAATQMLNRLSNDRHEVKTGIVLMAFPENQWVSHLETTQVFFKPLAAKEISEYVATGSPFDKAGGYGIQDDAGKNFILKYNGLYSNIIGLPTERLPDLIKKLNSILMGNV